MITVALILFGLIVVAAGCILGYIVFDYYKVKAEFEQSTPQQVFWITYWEVRNARLQENSN